MVGDLFKLRTAMLGNPAGTVGVVFNDYGSGQQLIFPNGNYDGFSGEEQADFLEFLGHEAKLASYGFTNVVRLGEDFRRGYWREVL